MDDHEFVKVSFSLRRGVVRKLRTLTKARHGRVERFMSATVEEQIERAYAELSDEQKREMEQEDE